MKVHLNQQVIYVCYGAFLCLLALSLIGCGVSHADNHAPALLETHVTSKLSEPEAPSYGHNLQGRWFIVATTFPLWLEGDKICPTIQYDQIKPGVYRDTVAYQKKKVRHTILGKDTVNAHHPNQLKWRGSGWLLPFTSHWQINEQEAHWMVISFSSTWLTPSGMDILTDGSTLTDQDWQKIYQVIQQDINLRSMLPALQQLDRSPCSR